MTRDIPTVLIFKGGIFMATIPYVLLMQLIPRKAKEAGLNLSVNELNSMKRDSTVTDMDCFRLERRDELITITAWRDNYNQPDNHYIIRIHFDVDKI